MLCRHVTPVCILAFLHFCQTLIASVLSDVRVVVYCVAGVDAPIWTDSS